MATGATEHIDATTADAFIVEVWSKKAIAAREQAVVFADLVDRRYEDDAAIGDTVHVPARSHLSVTSKNRSSNAALSYETITETNTDITIATWEYSAIAIETATKKQVNRDLLDFYAPEQGYALALSIDDVLAGLVDDFTQTVGTLAVANTYAELLRGDQYLNDANAPQSDRALVVAPAAKAGFMELDQFVHGDYSKLNGEFSKGRGDAYMGTWMKYPIYCSTNVEGTNAAGHDNGMFHRSALALVVQMHATTHKMFDIDYLAHKVAVEQLHGSKEMRDDHGVFVKGA